MLTVKTRILLIALAVVLFAGFVFCGVELLDLTMDFASAESDYNRRPDGVPVYGYFPIDKLFISVENLDSGDFVDYDVFLPYLMFYYTGIYFYYPDLADGSVHHFFRQISFPLESDTFFLAGDATLKLRLSDSSFNVPVDSRSPYFEYNYDIYFENIFLSSFDLASIFHNNTSFDGDYTIDDEYVSFLFNSHIYYQYYNGQFDVLVMSFTLDFPYKWLLDEFRWGQSSCTILFSFGGWEFKFDYVDEPGGPYFEEIYINAIDVNESDNICIPRIFGTSDTFDYIEQFDLLSSGNVGSGDYQSGYNAGIDFADSRVNTSSASYAAGRDAGIVFADNRVNEQSESYREGFDDGVSYSFVIVNTSSASYAAGRDAGIEFADSHVRQESQSYIVGYDNGYDAGHLAGYNEGYDDGYDAGIDFADNRVNEQSVSYDAGHLAGYNEGYDDGYDAGIDFADNRVNEQSVSYDAGYQSGKTFGYNQGHAVGVESAGKYNFITLFGAIVDAPLRALFGHTEIVNGVTTNYPGLFTMEVFGVDISGFYLGLFSLALIIAIIRLVLSALK